MSIDLRLLTYLVATVDQGSVTKAAQALHLTQPVLSRQLRELERRIGLSLFERAGRRLRLTPAGEEFLARARGLLVQADEVERAAAHLAAGGLDVLRLAVPTTTLTDVLAPFLATLEHHDPVPIVRELDPRGALAALQSGADLAIVTNRPPRGLASIPLAVLPIWAYVRGDDPWTAQAEVPLHRLVDRQLVLMTEQYRPRIILDRAVDEAGLTYGAVLECTNAQVAQALAAAGRGVAIVSDDPRFDLVPLRVRSGAGLLRIHLFAAWNPVHHAARELGRFATRISDFCVRRYGPEVRPVGSPGGSPAGTAGAGGATASG
ncbi:LysR family transcriptional regulator [Dactylosporangium sp. NPDC000244]|uniref:LysR family transcriptional regulator n=1 Tax=Dactylosporangium sp. NPDC000244 TaxID=3154365 RepID=UPI003322D95B